MLLLIVLLLLKRHAKYHPASTVTKTAENTTPIIPPKPKEATGLPPKLGNDVGVGVVEAE